MQSSAPVKESVHQHSPSNWKEKALEVAVGTKLDIS